MAKTLAQVQAQLVPVRAAILAIETGQNQSLGAKEKSLTKLPLDVLYAREQALEAQEAQLEAAAATGQTSVVRFRGATA